MNFVDLDGFWGECWGSLKRACAAPTRKNVGSLNPSKEQGARSKAGSELPGLIFIDPIGFHRFSWNCINCVDLVGFLG